MTLTADQMKAIRQFAQEMDNKKGSQSNCDANKSYVNPYNRPYYYSPPKIKPKYTGYYK